LLVAQLVQASLLFEQALSLLQEALASLPILPVAIIAELLFSSPVTLPVVVTVPITIAIAVTIETSVAVAVALLLFPLATSQLFLLLLLPPLQLRVALLLLAAILPTVLAFA
jgi:hypothetical protein